jgi:hypothetical protein
MRIRKSVAGVGAAALTIAGIGVIAAPTASAASYSLFQGINNTGLQAPAAAGTGNINVSISPASPNVGQPVTITVTSPDIAFNNGPAATVNADWTRIDAVVSYGGVDYLIKGPRNAGAAAPNTNIIAAGWTISSANGGDSATGAGGAANNTDGVDVINAAGVVQSTAAGLVAPANAGSYPVVLKAIVNNSVSSVAPATGGTGVSSINDGFDQIWGTALSVAPYSGTNTASQFGNVGSITAIGPNAAITSSTGQNAGVAAIRLPLPAATGWTGGPTVVGLSGAVWDASVASGGFTAQFCDVTGTTCDTPNPGGWSITNNISTDGTGALNAGSAITLTRLSFAAPGVTSGSRAIKLTQGTNVALVPVLVLGTPTVTLSPANGGPGTTVSVSGSNFNPSQAITLSGRSGAAAPYGAGGSGSAGTATTDTAATSANSTGAFSAVNIVVTDTATNAIGALQGTPPYGLSQGSNAAFAAFQVNQDQCTRQTGTNTPVLCETKQNITATVNAGALTQQAFAYSGPGSAGYTSTAIPMGAVTTSISSQTLGGFINPITVTDVRGGTATWSLTADMPDLVGSGTAAGASIEDENLVLGGVSCTAAPGSATGITQGAGGNFGGTALTVCDASSNAANSAGDTKGGQWVASAPLTLTVPAFQQAGAYASTITFTLT